jgi:D-glycero-D-manno-heptose 1,7-bisphosphate phosphatase
MTNKAVFLDKDGTLVQDVPYNVDPELIVLAPRAEVSLWRLHKQGFKIVVITNQSGVARGYFPASALVTVERHLRQKLASYGVPLAGFYYCPHHPEGVVEPYAIACSCRKPQPGLILNAAADLDIDLAKSWFVGDILHDVAAGRAAGCRTILVNNGNETEWELTPQRFPHHVVDNLLEATQVILAMDTVKSHEPILTPSY